MFSAFRGAAFVYSAWTANNAAAVSPIVVFNIQIRLINEFCVN